MSTSFIQPDMFVQPLTNWPFTGLEPLSFDFLMADPNWRFETWSESGKEKKSAEQHYRTASVEWIKSLPVADLARADCLLWLWATAPMLLLAIEVMDAWDFSFVTMGCWHKRTKHNKSAFGTGYVMRSACEPFLIGKRGSPFTTRSVRNIVVGPVREHSRKPDEAYEAAERMMPHARRADLFSRQRRPGWTAWGDQVGLFDQQEVA
jgi:N6-adenosine-specific RNA methylase IME4